jgi:hypothetical protein
LEHLVGRSLKATLPIFAKTKYLCGGEIKNTFYNYFFTFFSFLRRNHCLAPELWLGKGYRPIHGFYNFVWNPDLEKVTVPMFMATHSKYIVKIMAK